MQRSLLEVAQELATAHRDYDPATGIIKLFPSPEPEIHLLEISSASPTTVEVLPFRFGSDSSQGIDFPSVVIVLSPEEWRKVQEKDLSLPSGWNLSEARDL